MGTETELPSMLALQWAGMSSGPAAGRGSSWWAWRRAARQPGSPAVAAAACASSVQQRAPSSVWIHGAPRPSGTTCAARASNRREGLAEAHQGLRLRMAQPWAAQLPACVLPAAGWSGRHGCYYGRLCSCLPCSGMSPCRSSRPDLINRELRRRERGAEQRQSSSCAVAAVAAVQCGSQRRLGQGQGEHGVQSTARWRCLPAAEVAPAFSLMVREAEVC